MKSQDGQLVLDTATVYVKRTRVLDVGLCWAVTAVNGEEDRADWNLGLYQTQELAVTALDAIYANALIGQGTDLGEAPEYLAEAPGQVSVSTTEDRFWAVRRKLSYTCWLLRRLTHVVEAAVEKSPEAAALKDEVQGIRDCLHFMETDLGAVAPGTLRQQNEGGESS